MSAKPKVLLLTSELFPEFGYPTAGGGVRAEQLYRSLEEAGYPVQLGLARDSMEGKDLPDWAVRFPYRAEFLDGLIESADPDIVLSEGWEPLSHLKIADNRLYVADCPGPLVLENCLGEQGDLRANTFHKVRTLARLDAVLCPNLPMRFYVGGFLTLAGWSPDQCDRILQVPIALPEKLPERKPPSGTDLTLFVGGVSWAWHHSSEWLVRLADELDRRGIGRLRIRHGRHPHHDLEDTLFETLDSRLLHHPRVSAAELTDWQTLAGELTSIPVAIEWSPKHLEREVGSTLRIVTYLWCGVPVIVRPHLAMAEEIAEFEAGWVVDDWKEMAQLVDDLTRDPAQLQYRSARAQALARERHAWPAAHQPLLEGLERLSRREKQPSFLEHAFTVFRSQEEELHRLRAEHKFLHEEMILLREHSRSNQVDAEAFRSMRQKLPYRLWKKVMG